MTPAVSPSLEYGTTIHQVAQTKSLGVILDSSLFLIPYIQAINESKYLCPKNLNLATSHHLYSCHLVQTNIISYVYHSNIDLSNTAVEVIILN